MSQILLAELVDRFRATYGAFIAESAESVTVSNLSVEAARSLLSHVNALGWTSAAFDTEGNQWDANNLPEAFAPFRVALDKPRMHNGALVILTNFGFAAFLRVGHPSTVWRVARFVNTLQTRGRTFMSWEATDDRAIGESTKSPRALVRETAAQRLAPEDIRPWIAIDQNYSFDDDASRVWADACVIANLNAIPDEIESNTGNLKFKGPPRLSLSRNDGPDSPFAQLGADAFLELQRVVSWIYENDREAEVRHLLFSAEIARSGGGIDDVFARLKRDCSAAFDGAKIAYQMSISDLGKDTLRALGDLKKSVTEDTSRVADATRQTVTAVSSALAVGLGLLAARIASAASPWLIFGVLIIVALYVFAIVYSGYAFISLQRKLRVDWQPRLYRFLSDEDFKRMVKDPSADAETTFFRTATVGIVAVVLLLIAFPFTTKFTVNSTNNATPILSPTPAPAPALASSPVSASTPGSAPNSNSSTGKKQGLHSATPKDSSVEEGAEAPDTSSKRTRRAVKAKQSPTVVSQAGTAAAANASKAVSKPTLPTSPRESAAPTSGP